MVFKESELINCKEGTKILEKSELGNEFQIEVESVNKQTDHDENVGQDNDQGEDSGTDPETEEEEPVEDYLLCRDRSRRAIRPPERFGYEAATAYALNTVEDLMNGEPTSYQEAISSEHHTEWKNCHGRRYECSTQK